MVLHDWLLAAGSITPEEYDSIAKKRHDLTVNKWKGRHRTFQDPDEEILDPLLVSRPPLEDVLKRLKLDKRIYDAQDVSDFEGLVAKCQQWHVEHLEPIGRIPVDSRFVENLRVNKAEKKLVAWFLTNARVRNGGTIIEKGDNVVIPDGSSAYYVGLAVAAWSENVSIITSNAQFYYEYLANPALAREFIEFHVIGGEARRDQQTDRPEHGGVFGEGSDLAYQVAIQKKPRATVVVVPVSGLLPDEGPYATDGDVRGLRHSLILESVGEKPMEGDERPPEKVRELVFIGDYSKHLESKKGGYGAPVFNRDKWHEILRGNRESISLVTAPPEALREALASASLGSAHETHAANRTTLTGFGGLCREYNEVAHRFGQQLFDEKRRPAFHEAIRLDDEWAVNSSVVTVSGLPPSSSSG